MAVQIYRQDELQSAMLANEREGLCSLLDRQHNDAQVSAFAFTLDSHCIDNMKLTCQAFHVIAALFWHYKQ